LNTLESENYVNVNRSVTPLSPGVSRRRFLGGTAVVSGLVLASPLLAACGGTASSTANGSKTIGLSLNGLVEYTRYVAQGLAKAFEGTEYGLKIVQANFDPQTELRNIEALVSQGVSGLVIEPNTVDAITSAVREADKSKIPSALAIWAAPGPLDNYLKGVSALDSVGGGRMIGEWLLKNGKPGKTIVVQGVVGQGFSERIDQGLDLTLKGSGFDVVVREQGFFDRSKAIGVVERALQAHPDATTIVSYAAAMGDGIASYLQQNKITGVTHVTSDADKEMLDWLKTPYLSASRYYSAAETGLVAGQVVRSTLEGKKVEFENKIFQTMMTAENADMLLKQHPMSYPELDSALKGL
jgi:ribose transport system substrate-binding protein